jgi:WD40 repeat protein
VDIVTCGVKHIDFWTHEAGAGKLKSQKALFERAKIVSFTAAAFLPKDGNALIGTASGGLYAFKGRQFAKEVGPEQAHSGPVLSMSNHKDVLITAGKDGKVIVWKGLQSCKDSDFNPALRLVLDLGPKGIHPFVGERGIRSAQLSPDGKRLLLGTQSSEIYELGVDLASKNDLGVGATTPEPLISGHFQVLCRDFRVCITDAFRD